MSTMDNILALLLGIDIGLLLSIAIIGFIVRRQS